MSTSLAALRQEAGRLRQVQTRVVDGADHAMMLGVAPSLQVDTAFATRAAPDAPAYFALLGSWLTTVTSGQAESRRDGK